ncbi:uncharacterized protein LOC122293587 [Carya illinoinensis]|uniref:uncharacterized protein LOC122293587 n=1 Tax=Carya illinoinensis TaxID=32201 RepID=UPI001C71BFA2|nr:uncharacterized protein LOC122293587 [Carya illinoinensis]
MKCISWNFRGLGNPRTVQELHLLVRENVSDFVFLMETKCSRNKVEQIRNQIGFQQSFVVNSKGYRGGLAFLWKDNKDVALETYTRNHISISVKILESECPFILTGFYGNPETSKRNGSLELLKALKPKDDKAWICLRDFDEILHQHEKKGAAVRPYRQVESFRETVEACDLSEIQFLGNYFTWSNRREGRFFTKEKLDRAFGNPSYLRLYEDSYVTSLVAHSSDHSPIVLQQGTNEKRRYKARPFRYESKWDRREECKELIEKAWTTPVNQLSNLFTSSEPSKIEDCIKHTKAIIIEDMNKYLIKKIENSEIEEAVFSMNGLGSPGPDGFPAIFYQTHWTTVGPKVCVAIKEAFQTDSWPSKFNATYIALIPRTKNPTKVTDSNLSHCAMLITNNVIVSFEALHTMQGKLRGREGYMALKLDMSKAYDRIEWVFLAVVMKKMGFSKKWIEVIMRCISTVSYAILINGMPQESFTPTRGIRQGDPLSPYLFILCAKVLSCMLQAAETTGALTGVPLARNHMNISHLFFANDSLLFCKANPLEWSRLIYLLEVYENASGQRFNKDKTSIYFSKNTNQEVKEIIVQIAGIQAIQPYEKYLDLPALIGRSRSKGFKNILDRARSRISN